MQLMCQSENLFIINRLYISVWPGVGKVQNFSTHETAFWLIFVNDFEGGIGEFSRRRYRHDHRRTDIGSPIAVFTL
jgi:hypothetical protein